MTTALRESSRVRSRVAAVAMAAYVLLVAAIVFAPSASVPTASVAWIVVQLDKLGSPGWVTPSTVEFATNVLLFVPLGFLGWFLKPKWTWLTWTFVGFAASGFIELTQLVLLSGRSATLVDVAANTLGSFLGACAASVLRHTMAR